MQKTYNIVGSFKGTEQIARGFQRVRSESERTTRSIVEGARTESKAVRESAREQARARREVLQGHQLQLRQMRQQQRELQQERQRALTMIGVGTAGLAGTAGGIKVAADFEASMTELRLSIQEVGRGGATDLAKLNEQMARLEQLAVKLGNRLPGTTKDFVDLFISMKEGGIATETILGGAGDAVANLAVLTKSDPKVLGKQFAQVGMAYNLKPEEYLQATETFHKLYRKGVTPEELIEGSKFFAPRAGVPLGLTGIKGLTASGELLGALRRRGLEGGVGGRELSMMMTRMTFSTKPQQEKLAELKKKGIDLQFFNKQGEFAGTENMVAQLEKLKKLSPKDKLEALHKLFTAESSAPASQLIDLGVEGLRQYRAELEAVVPTQQAVNQLQKDFGQKWEAMMGTGQNVVVRLFTPMMDSLKPIVDTTNQVLASLEGWSKENPEIAKFATTLIGLGSTTLIVVGGFKAATTTLGLWRLATRLATAENAMLRTSMAATGAQAGVTSRQLQTTGAGWGARLGSSIGKGLLLAGAVYGLELWLEGAANSAAAKEEARAAGESLGEILRQGAKQRIAFMTDDVRREMQRAQSLTEGPHRATVLLGQEKAHTTETSPWSETPSKFMNNLKKLTELRTEVAGLTPEDSRYPHAQKEVAIHERRVLGDIAGQKMTNSEQVGALLDEMRKRMEAAGTLKHFGAFELAVQQVYPGLFAELQTRREKEAETARALSDTTQELNRFKSTLSTLTLPPGFGFGGPSTGPGTGTGGGGPVVPFSFGSPGRPKWKALEPPKIFQSRAMGGDVKSEGFVKVHAGEQIVPANVTRGVEPIGRSAGGSITLNNNVKLTIDGSASAQVKAEIKREIERSVLLAGDKVIAIIEERARDYLARI